MTETAERTCYRHPDRVTGLSCSECGRPICTECMTVAPVGLRCPDHAGSARRRRLTPPRVVARAPRDATYGLVTKILIGLNVAVYLIGATQPGASISNPMPPSV